MPTGSKGLINHISNTNGSVIRDNRRHCLNYQNEVHDILTIVASYILSTLIGNVNRYETKRIQEYKWVVRKLQWNHTSSRRGLPDFDVLETVTMNKTKQPDTMQLHCSCNCSIVFRLPCIHSMVVSKSLKPKWKNITHYDVSVR